MGIFTGGRRHGHADDGARQTADQHPADVGQGKRGEESGADAFPHGQFASAIKASALKAMTIKAAALKLTALKVNKRRAPALC